MMPFYTFTRNNIPFQMRGIVMEPHNYAKLGHGWEAVKDVAVEDERWEEDIFPKWVIDNMGFAMKGAPADFPGAGTLSNIPVLGGMFESQHPIAVNLSSLPAMDLNKLFSIGGDFMVFNETAQQEALGYVNPILKTPLEYIQNVDSFTKGPIRENEEAWPFLQNDVGAMLPGYSRDGSGNVNASKWTQRVARQVVPPVGQLERFLGSTERYEDRQLTSVASNIAGLPISTLDAFQLKGKAYRERERLHDAVRDWRGKDVSNEEINAMIEAGVPPEVFQEAADQGRLDELVDLVLGDG